MSFLTSNPESRAQKEVQNIMQSYSNSWDIVAELAQNAVDAVKTWEENHPEIDRDHSISIKIDEDQRQIVIEDSGIGIDPGAIDFLLAPNGTDKTDEGTTIGEKGVGLTFCIFCTNKFEIETTSTQGRYKGKIELARTWLNSDDPEGMDMPDTDAIEETDEEFDPSETGTVITLNDVEVPGEGESVFTRSPKRMEYLLRTKTAIGNTRTIHEEETTDIDVTLELDNRHDSVTNSIDFGYYYPHELWDDDDVVDLEEIMSSEEASLWDDEKKEREVGGKVWMIDGTHDYKGREIRYYACFVHSTADWEDVARQHELYRIENPDEDEEDHEYDYDLGPGIFVATRGMPTGISIDPPSDVGEKVYFNQMFMILEYDGFTFDVGRKSIPGPTQGRTLKPVAKKKFNVFRRWKALIRDTSTPPEKPPEIDEIERRQQLDELEDLPDLNYGAVKYLKKPDGQEAAVVSIFHELIGSGELPYYRCLKTGYKRRYDFWGKYVANTSELGENIQEQLDVSKVEKTIVVEHKYDAEDIISDVENSRKYFENIDLILCWDISQDSFEERGIEVEPLHDSEIFYIGSNYKLTWPTSSDLGDERQKPVLALKQYIEDRKRSS